MYYRFSSIADSMPRGSSSREQKFLTPTLGIFHALPNHLPFFPSPPSTAPPLLHGNMCVPSPLYSPSFFSRRERKVQKRIPREAQQPWPTNTHGSYSLDLAGVEKKKFNELVKSVERYESKKSFASSREIHTTSTRLRIL